MKSNRYKQNLVSNMLNELNGLVLAHVFVKTKTLGYSLRVSSIDGIAFSRAKEKDEKRVNVDVNKGIVKKSWIG